MLASTIGTSITSFGGVASIASCDDISDCFAEIFAEFLPEDFLVGVAADFFFTISFFSSEVP